MLRTLPRFFRSGSAPLAAIAAAPLPEAIASAAVRTMFASLVATPLYVNSTASRFALGPADASPSKGVKSFPGNGRPAMSAARSGVAPAMARNDGAMSMAAVSALLL